ncbi:MAG: UDP-glucose/GDP-mannose dehydrogenase family protein [Dehalococcoidia bacterium]|nr:UDP-glucose/GDP-mannose dehydrogenase family protein [Dehalococcoidia bacterium]
MAINNKEVISVIGLGVVGLTTAVGFALKGHRIIGIDIDPEKVKTINKRVSPIYEEGLSRAMMAVSIEATTDFEQILESDISFLCGGTPGQADGSIDLHYVQSPVEQLAKVLKEKDSYHLVVVRSTVVPGTTEAVIAPKFPDTKRVGLCTNPEFLREGTAIEDFLKPSRIIIGERDIISGDVLCHLYRNFHSPTVRTGLRTAEMIKYASNSYLATRISFINEIGNICKELDIDVYDVAAGMGYDERIGHDYLSAGTGFGGFCLPKDVAALAAMARELGYEPRILREVLAVNEEQPLKMISLLKKHVPHLKGKVIGILGLAFKPGTDDVRKSKAIEVIEELLREGAQIKAHDPQAMKNFAKLFPDIEYVSAEETLESDAVLILTAWDEFNSLDYRGKIVIDGRKVPKAEEAMIYEGIGWNRNGRSHPCELSTVISRKGTNTAI